MSDWVGWSSIALIVGVVVCWAAKVVSSVAILFVYNRVETIRI